MQCTWRAGCRLPITSARFHNTGDPTLAAVCSKPLLCHADKSTHPPTDTGGAFNGAIVSRKTFRTDKRTHARVSRSRHAKGIPIRTKLRWTDHDGRGRPTATPRNRLYIYVCIEIFFSFFGRFFLSISGRESSLTTAPSQVHSDRRAASECSPLSLAAPKLLLASHEPHHTTPHHIRTDGRTTCSSRRNHRTTSTSLADAQR